MDASEKSDERFIDRSESNSNESRNRNNCNESEESKIDNKGKLG